MTGEETGDNVPSWPQEPTRVIRARFLGKYSVVVIPCAGKFCVVPPPAHQMTAGGLTIVHRLMLIDEPEIHSGNLTAICVAENGEQCILRHAEWEPIRVAASSPQPDTAPGENQDLSW